VFPGRGNVSGFINTSTHALPNTTTFGIVSGIIFSHLNLVFFGDSDRSIKDTTGA
jgi:hypothetical protein